MTLGELRAKTQHLPDNIEINISTGDVVAQTTAILKDDLDHIENYYKSQWWDIDTEFDTEKNHILLFVKSCIMY